jgi:hypothetical protein
MTKDEALIYWVMRYGVGGVAPEMIKSSIDDTAFNRLTPDRYKREWWIRFTPVVGWNLTEEALGRLKELGHD